jgi:hypothetical protein
MKQTNTSLKPVLALALLFSAASAIASPEPRPAQLVGKYNLHLYFGDSTPFLDVLNLESALIFVPGDQLKGDMHVPNDFDAPIMMIETAARRIVFDVLVPRNAARPKDLLFRYETQFMSEDPTKGVGFVRIVAEGQPDGSLRDIEPSYVASFLLFRQNTEATP